MSRRTPSFRALGPDVSRTLALLADGYEQARTLRQQFETMEPGRPSARSVADQNVEPIPLLARAYRLQCATEEGLRSELVAALRGHPAGIWVLGVPGCAPDLAARLLSRLDVHKADTISSFWWYCGLATVAAVEFRCADCGHERRVAAGSAPAPSHPRPDGSGTCRGPLRLAQEVRMAQPSNTDGGACKYDPTAKQICYRLGQALVKVEGPYQRYHRRELLRLAAERPGWAPGRRFATALRKTEKLFLAHLWLVWRRAVGLPVSAPHEADERSGEDTRDPWAMSCVLPAERATASAAAAPTRQVAAHPARKFVRTSEASRTDRRAARSSAGRPSAP
jgi:hypothetical protein